MPPADEALAALARRAISLIDLTDLGDWTDASAVDVLCARAREHGTAAVCVWPEFVAQAAGALSGTDVRVATVVNFPSGDERPFAVGLLTDRALDDGATEIDVVLPYRAWLDGDEPWAAVVLDTVRECVGTDADRLVKVILETGSLPDATTVDRACRFAIDRGADFVKTSTGKTEHSATPEAVEVMLEVVAGADRAVGVKPSGGIRTVADATEYLELADRIMGTDWAGPSTFRFGASGLLDALVAVLDEGGHGPEVGLAP